MERVEKVRDATSDALVSPHPEVLAEVSSDPAVIANLREIHLVGNVDSYARIDFGLFANLDSVVLYSTYQTDEFLKALASHSRNIRSLAIEETDMTDAGLASISKMENLHYLSITSWSGLTSAGINQLKQNHELTRLTLNFGAIKHDLSELTESLPDCEIRQTTDE